MLNVFQPVLSVLGVCFLCKSTRPHRPQAPEGTTDPLKRRRATKTSYRGGCLTALERVERTPCRTLPFASQRNSGANTASSATVHYSQTDRAFSVKQPSADHILYCLTGSNFSTEQQAFPMLPSCDSRVRRKCLSSEKVRSWLRPLADASGAALQLRGREQLRGFHANYLK